MRIPIIAWSAVYHVGNLAKHVPRRNNSWEGPGLSVSRHPNAWRDIARLGGTTYRCVRRDNERGRFVDVRAALSASREPAWARTAVADGWVKPSKAFRVSYYDVDEDDTRFSLFDTLDQAENEAGDIREYASDVKVEKVDSYKPTPKLRTWWRRDILAKLIDDMAIEMAVCALAEERGYDGAWWTDRYDPLNLSAPRGVIFMSRLNDWQCAPRTR